MNPEIFKHTTLTLLTVFRLVLVLVSQLVFYVPHLYKHRKTPKQSLSDRSFHVLLGNDFNIAKEKRLRGSFFMQLL